MSTVLAHIANFTAAWLLSAWLLMITVGVVHAEWIPQLPTIGFGLSLLLCSLIAVRIVFTAVVSVIGDVINGGVR